VIIDNRTEWVVNLPYPYEPITVKMLPTDFRKLEKGCYYPVGEYLYKYIGRVDKIKETKPGTIAVINNRYFINDYDEDDDMKDFYHIRIIRENDEASDDIFDLSSIMESYIENFDKGNNLIVKTNAHQKVTNTSGVFTPELNATDDALTRIMKKMIIHKKLVPSECRPSFKKDYSFDNMRSALTGATANMTITKFMAWCELLGTEWQFTVEDNGTDLENPLKESLSISSDSTLECEFGEPEKGIFKVELSDKDDPLKRLIKVAIIKKHININRYKDRGSTPYLLNNMRSALKGTSKMMVPYFVNWCEILGLNFYLRVIDPSDGVFFESNVNYKADEYDINE
jgi:hypothetical protein